MTNVLSNGYCSEFPIEKNMYYIFIALWFFLGCSWNINMQHKKIEIVKPICKELLIN